MSDQLLQFAGRLHPLILHMPIGMLGALFACEAFAFVRRRPLERATRLLLVWLVALSGAASAATGLLLSREDAYSGSTLQLHQWLGIGVGVLTLLAAILATAKARAYGLLLIVSMGIIIPTGHFGAEMTHGAEFLFEPFKPRTPAPMPSTIANASFYQAKVLPIFQAKCVNCHKATRKKGGLALDTPEAILAGGDIGPAIKPGDPKLSEMMVRLRLPLEHDDHMPPQEKPQPTEAEIAIIEQWIAEGAKFDAKEMAKPVSQVEPRPSPQTKPKPSAEDLSRLSAAQVHAEFLDDESRWLWVSFSAVPEMPDEEMAKLLAPLSSFIEDLSLARSKAGERTMAVVATMTGLVQLDLSGTGINAAALANLKPLKKLEELRLTRTSVGSDAAPIIAGLSSLKRLFVWKSGLTERDLESIRAAVTGVSINTGETSSAKSEPEPEFKLSSEAPVPGAVAAAPSLEAVNTVCPVSGQPVNAKFRVVHDDKVVGFCCEKCAAQFLVDPTKFTVKVGK